MQGTERERERNGKRKGRETEERNETRPTDYRFAYPMYVSHGYNNPISVTLHDRLPAVLAVPVCRSPPHRTAPGRVGSCENAGYLVGARIPECRPAVPCANTCLCRPSSHLATILGELVCSNMHFSAGCLSGLSQRAVFISVDMPP